MRYRACIEEVTESHLCSDVGGEQNPRFIIQDNASSGSGTTMRNDSDATDLNEWAWTCGIKRRVRPQPKSQGIKIDFEDQDYTRLSIGQHSRGLTPT